MPMVSYKTLYDCNADIPYLITKHAAGETILGTCVNTDPSSFQSDATIVWDISKSGKLTAGLILSNPKLVAAANLTAGRFTLQ